MRETHRAALQRIFLAGVAAVRPDQAVRAAVSRDGDTLRVCKDEYLLHGPGSVVVLGAGKGTAPMARAVEEILGERIRCGRIVVKVGHELSLQRIACDQAGHPVPDAAGLAATQKTLEMLRGAAPDDLVLGLLSGGASALWTAPADGLGLADKQAVTQALLSCGATIQEINAVRKHLSAIKGGRLAQAAFPARVVSLIVSDVLGDDLSSIASGPTAADPTSYADALGILERYGLREIVPEPVLRHLESGRQGLIGETPKPGDERLARTRNHVIASNRMALEAEKVEAEKLGYQAVLLPEALRGEAREMGRKLMEEALRRSMERPGMPLCLIAGGETTVTLQGTGLGGRNQETALAAALALNGRHGITLLCAGTDGNDGPTDAAGAFADGDSVRRGAQNGLDAVAHLAANDSYRFFHSLGDLLRTGPTRTNVMDTAVVLLGDGSPGAPCG